MADNGRRIVGAPLPGATLPYLPLFRPGPGQGGQIEGWILSPFILGVATHYCRGRTQPCTRHLDDCEGCDFWKKSPRWDGFIGVLAKLTRKVAIFQVTKGAADACESLEAADTLRGRYVSLRRRGESAEGRVVMSLREEPYRGVLPPAPNVPGALERLWSVNPAYIGRAIISEERMVE